MKNFKILLSTVVVAGSLVGCSSGWNQDPLANKNGKLQNGQENPTRDEKPQGTGSDTIRLIMTPEVFTFAETTPGEIQFAGRVLKSGYSQSIVISNLADFPGARFDAASGKFNWTPALGTVSNAKGTDRETKILKVTVVGQNPSEGVIQKDFPVKLEVTKQLSVPEIFGVSTNNITIREGEVKSFTVNVRDKDAGTAPGTWPSLQAYPLLGYSNISPFVTVTNNQNLGNGVFAVTLKIDLTNAELTKSKSGFGLALQAVSQLQKGSMMQNIYVNVLTSFSTIQSTWVDVLNVSLGQKQDYTFMVLDPKDEMSLDQPTFTGLPTSATVNCTALDARKKTQYLCKLSWNPDFTSTEGNYPVRVSFVGRNSDPTDTATQTQNLDLVLNVLSAPVMNPTSVKGVK